MGGFEKQDRAARLFKVAQILTASGGIKTADLAKRTGRHQRTALRDLQALEEIGVPVYLEGDVWRVQDGYFVPAISFTQPEAVALLLAGRLAVRQSGRSNETLGMALTKIAKALPKEAQLVARYFTEIANELAAKGADQDAETRLGTLVQGWLQRRKVRISYRDAQGKVSERVVRPYYLEPASTLGGGTYVIGHDELSKSLRAFKVERVTGALLEREQYYLPKDFSLARHLRHSWGIWSEDPVEKVELRFTPAAATRVAETVWHPSQKLTREPAGSVRLMLLVRGHVEIRSWILGWGADVEVLGPASLRAELKGIAAELARTYA